MSFYLRLPGEFSNNFREVHNGCFDRFASTKTSPLSFNGSHLISDETYGLSECREGCEVKDLGSHVFLQFENKTTAVVGECPAEISADMSWEYSSAPSTFPFRKKGTFIFLALIALIQFTSAQAIEAVGLVAGVLGITSFGLNQFASPANDHVNVRFAAAEKGVQGISGQEGQIPYTIIRSSAHEVTQQNWQMITRKPAPGFSTSWRTFGHDQTDATVETSWDGVNNNPPENQYPASEVELYPGKNSICLAWVDVSNPFGARDPMVYGDVGYWCGRTWYYSGWYNGAGSEVRCMWMGQTKEPGPGTINGMSFDGAYFNMEKEHDPQKIMDDTCNVENINFERPNVYPIGDEWLSRREDEEVENISNIGNNLLIYDGEGAYALCESPTSFGPSFYSETEEALCYMVNKEIYPICNDTIINHCYDASNYHIRHDNESKRSVDFISAKKWSKPKPNRRDEYQSKVNSTTLW